MQEKPILRCYATVVSFTTDKGTEFTGNVVNLEKIIDGMKCIDNVNMFLNWRKTEKEAYNDLLDWCNKRKYLLEQWKWKPKKSKK